MRRRFFVDEVRSGKAEISGDEAKHLTRVLRVEVGQLYEISDNRSVYLAEISTARKEHVEFAIREKLPPPTPTVGLTLCLALVKFDAFELAVEKATELGVTRMVPVETVRCERGLRQAAAKRIERWRRIALEASQQSRRAHLPEISDPIDLTTALDVAASTRYFLDEESGGTPLAGALPSDRFSSDEVALLVGPEGGWTESERATATAKPGWVRVSLGPLILRAETAAIAALSVLSQEWLVGAGKRLIN